MNARAPSRLPALAAALAIVGFLALPLPAGASPGVPGSSLGTTAPDTDHVKRSGLGVVTLAPDDAWYVGQQLNPGLPPHTLARHWDGTRWTNVATPNPGDKSNILTDVSVGPDGDLWAVGTYQTKHQPRRLLALRWDGSRWIHTTVPQRTGSAFFTGVEPVAADDVWAVGQQDDGSAVVEHWDGAHWTAATGVPGLAGARLGDVVATSANDVWAVGQKSLGSRTIRSFVLHFDGNAWAVVASPNARIGHLTTLTGVTAVGPDVAWAVGYRATRTDAHPFVLRWDGSTWAIANVPALPDHNAVLEGVDATSADDVWAVGDDNTPAGDVLTLIEHWDGQRWQRVESPNPRQTDFLAAVSAESTTDAWAVGGTFGHELILLHWDGSGWTP